ncbi:major capsid protein P2 [Pelagibius sp.]|uniref:major capsid protein P2 n=1 Tax=Pelagibius sp. TaxID=1931238 RepID=UPI002608C622|nr:major capsid protein P2 [Pelagibius sp.]
MPNREIVVTNSFNAVAPGQKATLELAVGDLVYYDLLIQYGTSTAGGPTRANMEAEITQVAIKINGKVQRVFSAAQLFAIQEVNGIQVADGFLPIFFAEPWRRSVAGEEVLAWGMSDVDTFTVEIDIAPGATNPTLEARATINRVARPLGPIVKWRRFSVDASAVGIRNLTTLPKLDAYFRMHAFTANIGNVEVTVDQREHWNLADAQARTIYANNGLTVPASITSVIFDYTQQVSNALPMVSGEGAAAKAVSEFRVDFDITVAGAFTLLTETLGVRD